MIEAEIILDTRKKSKNGYPLKIRVYDTKVQKHRYIALKKYQNTKKLRVDSEIAKRERSLQKEVDYCNDNGFNLDISKKLIKNGIPQKQNLMLFEFIEMMLKEKEDREMSLSATETFRTEMENFSDDIPLKHIDYNWVGSYITHKKKSGTGDGGVSHYIRTGSGLFNEAILRGYIESNPFRGHKVKRKRTKPLILPDIEDIRKLVGFEGYGNKAQKANMVKVARSFLFQIHIGGHYFSELANLEEEKFKKGRIVFQRFKNRSKEGGGELVDNMLSDFAKAYIEEYGVWINTPQSERRLKQLRDNYNKTLERISLRLDITPKLNSSMPRYIFRSAGGQSRASEFAIHQLMGHKPQSVSFGYQERLPYDILDAEHQRILDWIFN